ncbi:hypothetical protein EGW08_019282 [Elysia chlorotica]|uniref:G-protein coupled receptors family 1 profile domain-containing protein n=1 Tax=Elysia chlorotica TaxID=188477 RepID=A0A433SUW6_ELYCH|nr:hypothetical protein EGW08_019282 [Elysia chlorotica]
MSTEGTTEVSTRFPHIPEHSNIVSDELLELLQIIIFVGVISFISILGIIGNIINILIYHRIGFKESVTVSLFALAISDLALNTIQLYIGVCQHPGFRKSSEVGMLLYELNHNHVGILRSSISRVSMWITVIITVERCMCIMLPTRVRQILTPKMSVIIIVSCTILNLLSGFPMYSTLYVGQQPIQGTNRTRLGILATSNAATTQNATAAISVFMQLLSLVVIAISVCALLVAMNHQNPRHSMKRDAHRGSAFSRSTKARRAQQTNMLPSLSQLPQLSRASTTPVHPKSHSLEPPVRGKQTTTTTQEAEATQGQSVYTIKFKDFPAPEETAEDTFYEDQSSFLTTLEFDPSNGSQDSTSVQASTSRAFKPTCPQRKTRTAASTSNFTSSTLAPSASTPSSVDIVFRLTQQRMWRAGKMVAVLSLIIFTAHIPGTVLYTIVTTNPQEALTGRFANVFSVMWGFAIVLELLNASVNIIVYYNMSSNYRRMFHHLMTCHCKRHNKVASSATPNVSFQIKPTKLEGRGPLIGRPPTVAITLLTNTKTEFLKLQAVPFSRHFGNHI